MDYRIINHSGKPQPKYFIEFAVNYVSFSSLIMKSKQINKLSVQYFDKPKLRQVLAKKSINLVFLTLNDAKKLNNKFRKKNTATDVLSFSPIEPSSLGELVFCPKIISRQAKQNRLLYREELAYLIIHGILHLLGYEHENDENNAKVMYDLQDEIFSNLCIAYKILVETNCKRSLKK